MIQRLIISVIALMVPLAFTPSLADTMEQAVMADLGPAIGTAIPEPLFSSLNAQPGENGTVLVFVRSVDWCPFCKKQVAEISAATSDIKARGFSVVFLSHDTPQMQERFREQMSLKDRFISDQGSQIIMSFGLLNESYAPDSRAYGVPHPAIFILDAQNIIRAKLFEADWAENDKSYRNRPSVDAILAASESAMPLEN